jgi:hypothetical protein
MSLVENQRKASGSTPLFTGPVERKEGQASTERWLEGLGTVKRHDRSEARTGFGSANARRTVQFEEEFRGGADYPRVDARERDERCVERSLTNYC